MKNKSENKDNLLNRIKLFIRKDFKRKLLDGSFKFISLQTIIYLILVLLESFGYFSVTIRKVLFSIFIISAIINFFLFIFRPLKKLFTKISFNQVEKAATFIGEKYSDIKDQLINALQIIFDKKNSGSSDLVIANFNKLYIKISNYNFLDLIDYSKTKNLVKLTSLVILIFVISLFFSKSLRDGAFRLNNFNTHFTKPSDFKITLLNESFKIKKGENYLIRFNVEGKIPNDIFVALKDKNESEFKNEKVENDSSRSKIFELKNLRQSFSFYVFAEDQKTEMQNVEITSPPIINGLTINVIPPKYSRLARYSQDNVGNLSFLKGTKIKFDISSTEPLLSAAKINYDSTTNILEVKGNKAKGEFFVYNSQQYYLEITDSSHSKNENPITYSIEILEDKFPEINITRPEQISLLPTNDIISINYTIKDDFGFSKVLLNYKIVADEFATDKAPLNLNISKQILEQEQYFNWDVARLGLKENEILEFYLSVYDNDVVSGPKFTNSSVFKIKVPSLNELFLQAEEKQNDVIQKLDETIKKSDKLEEELSKLKDDLKQNEDKIDWNEKEKIEDALDNFEQIKNDMKNIQEKLDNVRKEMTENNLLSEETMQKYNELQDLMDEINSEELQKAMEAMQKSLENMMRQNVQNNLDNFSANEEMFKKSLERTLNLLKKIQLEQKMDELIKRTEKITEDLEKLQESTKDKMTNDENSDQQLSEQQDNISEQIDQLKNEMENASKKMEGLNNTPKDQMDKLNQDFENQENQKLSEDTKQNLEQQNFEQAMQQQQMLKQNMSSTQNQLQQMQQQMQQQSQQMVMQDMLKAIDNIIGLSKEQEKLLNQTEKSLAKPNYLQNLTGDQQDLKQSVEKILQQLGKLSQQSFAISPEMGKALGDARNKMNNSTQNLQNKNGNNAKLDQSSAMTSLNEAAQMLQNSLQNMMQGGGQGGGMMSLMQQLEQMAKQQMSLNSMTQMMKQGQLSMQQQAQMQRLAREQTAIQKSLQELNKEAKESGNSKKIASNIEKILEEMREVISGFNTKKIDDDLIRKQDKILSKLLDAQRSINERDFEENREARSGNNFNNTSPDQLVLSKEKSEDLLREELQKAIREGYSKDYEELIKNYFESLKNSSKKN